MNNEFYGKTVQDAIKVGLDALNIALDEADIQILTEGSKGIFGLGAKRACVRISPAEEDGKEQKNPEPELESKPMPSPKPQAEKKLDGEPSKGVVTEAHLTYIETFLTGLFTRMGIEAQLDIHRDGDCITVNVKSDKTGKLIGYRGETLDAIQYVTRLALHKNNMSYKSVIVQTENYREKREQTLECLAKRLAQKVRKTRKKIVLEPMKPYERRIIHAALQGEAEITTWSEGEEPKRHVVIGPKKEK